MVTNPPPVPTGKFDWQRLILSLDIPMATKAVALALSVYASRDGSSAHPGNQRLAWALCADERTVRRHLTVLRDELRLIERTFYGQQAGRRGLADTYQLVLPWDLVNRTTVRDYGPALALLKEHRTPESADSDQEHRTPESADTAPSLDGTPDSGAGTADSGAGTVDTRVHSPGSTHQVVISPTADSIVVSGSEVNGSVEGGGPAPGQDHQIDENQERNRQLAELEAMMRQPVGADHVGANAGANGHLRPSTIRRREALKQNVVATITSKPGINGMQLQATIGGNRTVLLGTLNNLIDAGVVVADRDPSDKRKISYRLAARVAS